MIWRQPATAPVGAFADAPETATISGQIVDPGGSPLPGVSVTLSGERGDKFGITDENGAYRFVGVTLTPGSGEPPGSTI